MPSRNSKMFPEKPELALTIPARTELLKMVVELSEHFAILNQFSTEDSQKIGLVMDEAVTNIINHSYQKNPEEEIRVEFYISGDGIKIKLIFSGLQPVMKEKEINLINLIKNKKKGGLGVTIMRKIMDSVNYQRYGEMNCCELIKWKTKP